MLKFAKDWLDILHSAGGNDISAAQMDQPQLTHLVDEAPTGGGWVLRPERIGEMPSGERRDKVWRLGGPRGACYDELPILVRRPVDTSPTARMPARRNGTTLSIGGFKSSLDSERLTDSASTPSRCSK